MVDPNQVPATITPEEAPVVPAVPLVAAPPQEAAASNRELVLPEATQTGAPPWATVPPGIQFPRGRQVLFVRFRAGLTETKWKGDRQAILWSISTGDKKLALGRALGDPNRLSDEMTRRMVRAIDGVLVDETGMPGAGNLDVWWDEIGEKCRSQLSRIFVQLHVISRDEAVDFFENCIAVRVATG